MKEVIRILSLTNDQYSIVINALNDLRNKMLEQGLDTYEVDELLLKTFRAPEKKRMFTKNIEER